MLLEVQRSGMGTDFNNNSLYYSAIACLNKALEGSDERLISHASHEKASHPLVLRIGSSRSGSTLFTQWVAATGAFVYPSNVMALFQKNPLIGAYVQALLTDRRFRLNGEFDDLYQDRDSDSISGKTRGAASPNEFWGFWLEYFSFPRTPVAANKWTDSADFARFNRDVNAIISFFDKPFLLKGHNLTHYLGAFSKRADNTVYIHMYRDPIDVIVSVLKARVTRYGDPDYFFGWRPPQYELLLSHDRLHQVAGQVYFNERALIQATPALGDRCILISYEQLCKSPCKIFDEIHALVSQHSKGLVSPEYKGPRAYKISIADSTERAAAARALRYWTSQYGSLEYSDGSTWA